MYIPPGILPVLIPDASLRTALPTHVVPDAAEGSTCGYTFDAHYTQGAQDYHQDKCVSRIMANMSDPVRCTAYMAGIGEGNPHMDECTVHDLLEICTHYNREFTQGDAEQLCAAMNTASKQFWAGYGRRQGHPAKSQPK